LILKLLAENRFPAIWLPSKELLDLRALLLHRHQWVRMRTRIQNALQAIALANGLRRGPSLWSYDGQAKIAFLPLMPHAAYRRSTLQAMYKNMESEIEKLTQQVAEQAGNRSGARLLMTHPGFFWIEHKKIDRAFCDTNCEATSIFQNVLDGVLILDNEATCLDGNPASAQILRVSRNELVGKSIDRFFADSGAFSLEWAAFLRRKHFRGRAELVAGDGSPVFVEFTAATNYVPGRHIFILCDVTERTRAEKSLRNSEERFRHMADNIQEVFG
jgi:PAS domain-containing protein